LRTESEPTPKFPIPLAQNRHGIGDHRFLLYIQKRRRFTEKRKRCGVIPWDRPDQQRVGIHRGLIRKTQNVTSQILPRKTTKLSYNKVNLEPNKLRHQSGVEQIGESRRQKFGETKSVQTTLPPTANNRKLGAPRV